MKTYSSKIGSIKIQDQGRGHKISWVPNASGRKAIAKFANIYGIASLRVAKDTLAKKVLSHFAADDSREIFAEHLVLAHAGCLNW